MLMHAADVFAQDAHSAPPTSSPSAATQPVTLIQKCFDELASTEPAVRDDARITLMGLTRADLEMLRDVVQNSRPLAPAQSAVLHEIVTHVYLAHDRLMAERDGEPPQGFLGVVLDPPDGGVQPNIDGTGVYIYQCMPGYCSFRWLRSGDIITGISLDGAKTIDVTKTDELINNVSDC